MFLKKIDVPLNIRRTIYRFAKKIISRAHLVEGTMKGSNQLFRCLIVENSNIKSYLIPKIYEHPPVVLQKRIIWIPMLKKIIQKNTPAFDMCIALIPKYYIANFTNMANYRTQAYIRQKIDITSSWEETKKAFHRGPKETERKIRRYGFTCRISHDLQDFDIFYYKMFLPLMDKQYGNSVYIDTYNQLKEYFLKGFLLIVMDKKQPISGGLCFQEKNNIICFRVGVVDLNYRNKGAQSAIFYFLIQYAKDHNFETVDLTLSRFLLNDGVYIAKRKWGATTSVDSSLKARVLFFIPKHTDKISSFFTTTPIIIHSDNGLEGVVGWKDNKPISKESKKHLLKHYYAPGLSGLQLLTPDPDNTMRLSFTHTPPSIEREVG